MKKIVIGGLVGGVIIFLWSFLAWVILPLHESTMKGVTNEAALTAALQSSLAEKSVYSLPKNPGMKADQAAMEAWTERMKRGPNALIIYDPTGVDPMMPKQMVVGILLDIIAACIVGWFLDRSTALGASYIARVAYCGMFGIFLTFFTHLSEWNWMGMPADWTTAMIVDALVTWLAAGLGIAAFVKSPKPAAA